MRSIRIVEKNSAAALTERHWGKYRSSQGGWRNNERLGGGQLMTSQFALWLTPFPARAAAAPIFNDLMSLWEGKQAKWEEAGGGPEKFLSVRV